MVWNRVPVVVWSMCDSITARGTCDSFFPQLDSSFDPSTIPVGVSRDIGLLISEGTTGFSSRWLVVGIGSSW